jgi:hypothetical protein
MEKQLKPRKKFQTSTKRKILLEELVHRGDWSEAHSSSAIEKECS